MAARVKERDCVRVKYTGSLFCGIIFDFVHEDKPLEFSLGMGVVVAGFEKALIGMEAGEKKQVNVSPEDAFGEHRADLIVKIERSQLTFKGMPTLGMMFQIRSQNGEKAYIEIVDIDDDAVTFDANHILAGRELIYKIELLEIVAH